jgi:hypothetical protein
MPPDHANLQNKTTIGDAMLRAIAGGGGRLDNSKLKYGSAIFRGTAQIASGYVSDNAPYHAVEFALNQYLLAEPPFERAALISWLEHQKKRFGGRKPNIHQRGDPVDWFRIGFSSLADALIFLGDFSDQRRHANAFTRWSIRSETADLAARPAPVVAKVAPAEAEVSQEKRPAGAAHEGREESEPSDYLDEETGDEVSEFEEHVGNLSNEDYALACIPLLVEHVLRQTDEVMQTLTYEEVARRLGRFNKHNQPAARGLGVILGRAMEHIDSATAPSTAPYLTTIVVAKGGRDKGLPGVGLRERWHGYDLLTRAEKADRIEAEYRRIMQFGSQWNDVLRALGIASSPAADTLQLPRPASSGWGGGESAEHKALKEYVRTHPDLFGADVGSEWRATEEHALRSGDEIDVFFKSYDAWIGVEVKSAVSDGNLKDYERGLYQVVKYRAVLSAQAKIDHPSAPPTVQVVLALDGVLPPPLRGVAQSLGVRVVDSLGLAARYAAEVA